MLAYILIFYMSGMGAQGGPATAEFGDKAACEAAAQEVKKLANRIAFCVPKHSRPS